MKEILESILKNLVENDSAISINQVEKDKLIIFEVKVASEDMGKVIGKEGKIAKAIRNILRAIGARDHKKVTVEFID
ncbi:MAG: KH domain-containing protein [Clostridia bacterium]|nr:KH domain-containing protein [Clostridia bacterium]MCI8961322.1 KH domain-containing protein [Clostridia bacterium]